MEQCPVFEIPEQVEESFVLSSFLQATEFLKSRAGYIWENTDERVLPTLSIGTWSKKVQRSEIERRGTAVHKAMLPRAKARNQPHKMKRTFVIHSDVRADGWIQRLNKNLGGLMLKGGEKRWLILLQLSLAQIEKCLFCCDCLIFVSSFHECRLFPRCIMD